VLEVVLMTFGAVCWSVSMFMLGREWEKDHPKPARLGYWDGSDEQVVFTQDQVGDHWKSIPVRRGIYDQDAEG
jgi:hypothetical protein